MYIQKPQKLKKFEPIHIMPLQLIPIFFLISLLLPPAFSADLIAKPNCQEWCGSLAIPYPFGVGLDCSRDKYFDIKCDTSTDPPKPYLSAIGKEVIELNQTYIRVKYPNLVSTCYDFSGNQRINTTTTLAVDLSGTPYTMSSGNWLTAVGCDDVVLQSGESSSSSGGGCSAICADKNGSGGTGYCPLNSSSIGHGCCHVQIYQGNFERKKVIKK